jgi:hypothetical protein
MRPAGYDPNCEILLASLTDGTITPVTSVEELKNRFSFITDDGEAIALMRQACRLREREAGSVLILSDGNMKSLITVVVDPGEDDGGAFQQLVYQALGSFALEHRRGLGECKQASRSEYVVTAMPAFSYNSSHLKQIDEYGDYLVSCSP